MFLALEVIWSRLSLHVTTNMCIALMAPFSFGDLQDAICGLEPASCLGENGLLKGFCLEHWDGLHVHLL